MHTRRRIGQQNRIPNHAQRAKDDAEETPALHPVREERRAHVGDGADKVAWDGEELDLGGCPLAEIVDDGWEEGREAYVCQFKFRFSPFWDG